MKKKAQRPPAVDRCVERNIENIFICKNERSTHSTAIGLLNDYVSVI